MSASRGAATARRRQSISASEARRLALAAQGLLQRRPAARPDARALGRVIQRVGLIQIDSVNTLVRGHYLPLFSRLGPYRRTLLDEAWLRSPRRLFEYWGHEASLIPVQRHHLLRWRMDSAAEHADRQMRAVVAGKAPLVRRVLEQIHERGALAASELLHVGERGTGSWWGWSEAKCALEWLFLSGELACFRRRPFERLYDLSERVIPREALARPTPAPADAQRELVRIAASACGVATAQDLREYFRLSAADARARIDELVEAGELEPVDVEGWDGRPGYVVAGARIPRHADACSLVGPFDSVLWERSRLRRLYGFEYRIEMYTPAAKREYGYYVLPFLLGDRFAARVDVKADRRSSTLVVNAIHREARAPAETRELLDAELARLARWLELGDVRHPRSVRAA